MSAARARVPTDRTPMAVPPSDMPPAETPNPADAAVAGPCGLALALVPATPGQAAWVPPPRLSCSAIGCYASVSSRLRQAADQRAGRHDLAGDDVELAGAGRDLPPWEPADLNLSARIR